ncbi:MAG: LacI family DNA-binding transcriptional regulator [Verrucomicrobia bacterium]|nr:LacI family DNA-binding transcriptional regulator [Verrucomicrobiota bacterium]MCH8526254.1 LacI family DNA-binding transcriptional regulator [Kiritimatiellia bacterium]
MSPTSPRITLGMIAQKADVSRATVSRALRNHPQLPRHTCERIQAIAEDMGWRPDPETSRLMHHLRESRQVQRVSTLAILNDYPGRKDPYNDPYTAALLHSARRRADTLGYHIDELWLREPGLTARRATGILHARGITGVLVPPEIDPLPQLPLDWSSFSSVATTTTAQPATMNRVLPDNYGNLCKLMDALLRRKRKRVWLLSLKGLEDRTEHCPSNVYHAYTAQTPSLTTLPVFYWDTYPCGDDAAAAMTELYVRHKPDTVIVADAWLLDTLERRTQTRRRKDYLALCYSNAQPGLPGINQRPELVGSAAIDLLSAHILRGETGLPEVPKLLRIPGTLEGDL